MISNLDRHLYRFVFFSEINVYVFALVDCVFYGVRNDRTLINSLSLKVTHVCHFLVYMGNNGTESEKVDYIRIQQQSNYKTCYASSLDNSLDINTFAPSTKNKLICINERAVSEEWCFQCQITKCFSTSIRAYRRLC